jgi:hypothetical protein
VRTITDKTGQEWRLASLTLGLVLDIRDEAGVDFLQARGKDKDEAGKAAGEMLAKLYDPFTLGSVLWMLLGKQAEERKIDERAFAHLFESDTYPMMREAVLGLVLDFTLPLKVATVVKADLPRLMTEIDDALIAALKSSRSDLAA